MTMRISGAEEVIANLKKLTGRERMNVERKAMRQTMQQFRRAEQAMWKKYPVQRSSKEWNKIQTKVSKTGRERRVAAYSIRKAAAKAVTVKVGTRRRKVGVGFDVYGRTFLNYKKKNAKAANLAHLLDLGTKKITPRHRTRGLFNSRSGRMASMFIRALKLYIFRPQAKAKHVSKVLGGL